MQTNSFEIEKNVFWIGVNDYDLRVFDIVMETKFGTTYNAYLVIGSEKTALIDTTKVNFQDDYIAKLKSLYDITKIDYLVMNHTEPDHAGSIAKLLEINPDLTVIATTAGLNNIKEIINRPFKSIAAKESLEISLGDRTLNFMPLPFLHWPDTMFTYMKEEAMLFTCDFFGAHYAFEGVLAKNVDSVENYRFALKHYFDSIMSPFKKFVVRALDRIKDLKIKYVLTGHGPVVDKTNLEECTHLYREWSKPKVANVLPTVIIPYASAYGYTEIMAKSIKEGIMEYYSDKAVVELLDLVTTPLESVIDRIENADAFLIGSTTIVGDTVKTVWDVLSTLNGTVHGGKPAAAFGSYGWSGEAPEFITTRLNQLKMKTLEPLKIKFNPSVDQLVEIKAYGYKFAQFMQTN
jgi:NADH oxidase (H2O-forming)